jgi:micrococcal nuclease
MAVRRKSCDYCGQPIELRQLGPKHWKPFDPDGSPHDCPGRFEGGRPVVAEPPPAAAAAPTAASANLVRGLVVAVFGLIAAFVIIPRFFGAPAGNDTPPVPQVPGAQVTMVPVTHTPRPRPTATAPAAAAPANEAPFACDLYGNQVWAQTVFDENPRAHRDLDPDGDGFACEELPYGAVPALWTTRIPAQAEPVRLVSTIDGDTIVVRRENGRTENVRLVGIDTPETGKGSRPLECFGEEATDFTRMLFDGAEGGTVWLEKDVEDRDRYDRLLRYAWFQQDGEVYMANEAIVRAGYAERYRDTPNRRYYDRFIDAQEFAGRNGYGLWTACR